MTERDPNEGSTDPMIAEYWQLGEAVQDRILETGYDQETVDGIAVDIHDLLQAADLIRDSLAPKVLESSTREELHEAIERLNHEFHHLEWHAQTGQRYLKFVMDQLGERSST